MNIFDRDYSFKGWTFFFGHSNYKYFMFFLMATSTLLDANWFRVAYLQKEFHPIGCLCSYLEHIKYL